MSRKIYPNVNRYGMIWKGENNWSEGRVIGIKDTHIRVEISLPEAHSATSGMGGEKRKLRVVEVSRVEKVAIISFHILHELHEVGLEHLGFAEEYKIYTLTFKDFLQKENIVFQ